MKLLLAGKLPPIEGGVSGHTFWTARAMAARGHQVHVVTNAPEVEPWFSQLHYGDDAGWLASPPGRGRLVIHATEPLTPASYIPFAQPHLTKLLGLSLSVLARHRCDLALGWYLEPYGMVAALAGRAAGIPHVLRHAGSDLGRLARHPQLRSAYGWALRSAAALAITHERALEERFGRVSRPRLRLERPRLPAPFHQPAEPMDVPALLAASGAWFDRLGLPEPLRDGIRRLNEKPVPAAGDAFTFGVYGKVGVAKGSFDLVEALSRVAKGRRPFAFLALSCGRPEMLRPYYQAILRSPALAERTWVLPPVAPWRIPSFLRRCDAVCFLERDFPITFHGPLVPREVMQLGACLVCSAEIARKPLYGGNLVDDRNAVVIEDPRDHHRLAARLRALAADRDRARSIGLQGQALGRFLDADLPHFDDAAAGLADQLERLGARAPGSSAGRKRRAPTPTRRQAATRPAR